MHGRPYTPGKKEVVSFYDHRFLVKLCAIFVVIEVVFLHKNTTSEIFHEIMKLVKKKTTAVVFII